MPYVRVAPTSMPKDAFCSKLMSIHRALCFMMLGQSSKSFGPKPSTKPERTMLRKAGQRTMSSAVSSAGRAEEHQVRNREARLPVPLIASRRPTSGIT